MSAEDVKLYMFVSNAVNDAIRANGSDVYVSYMFVCLYIFMSLSRTLIQLETSSLR